MATSRYRVEINLEDLNTSHALAILDVPPASDVLDIGAADGSVAARLADRGCRVIAVEADADAAEAARSVSERVIEADIETLNLAAALDELEFDVVLLLDVLEHLRDPLSTLRKAADRLRPQGRIIVSVPNITHAAIRLQLLAGRFRYTDTGLLDRTHLHFFDRFALEQLVKDSGLTVLERMRTTRGLNQTEVEIDPDAFSSEIIERATDDPDAETYQFVYVLSREPAVANDNQPVSLQEALQQRAHRAEQLRIEAAGYARSLEARVSDLESERQQLIERAERARELEVELRLRIEELHTKHEELEHVLRDVAIRDEQLVLMREDVESVREERDRMERVLGYARHRLVDRMSEATHRVPLLHRGLKRMVERTGHGRP